MFKPPPVFNILAQLASSSFDISLFFECFFLGQGSGKLMCISSIDLGLKKEAIVSRPSAWIKRTFPALRFIVLSINLKYRFDLNSTAITRAVLFVSAR